MNLIGLDLNAVGNHEFDEGAAELRRMQEGGCHADGCFGADGFAGADFRFLATNVVDRKSRKPLFAPYAIRSFDKIKVGFIGMTLAGTPDIVSQEGIRDLDFLDEADTANRYARELRKRHGVHAIVVLLHEGGSQVVPFGVNSCNGISDPVVDIVSRTSPAVDLFVTGHTHQPYNCMIDGRPVTSASSFGRLVTDLDMTLDRRSKDVIEVRANNRVISQDVERAADVTALVTRYEALAAPLAGRLIGRITAAITRANDDSGENAGWQPDRRLPAGGDPRRRRLGSLHEPGRRARRHRPIPPTPARATPRPSSTTSSNRAAISMALRQPRPPTTTLLQRALPWTACLAGNCKTSWRCRRQRNETHATARRNAGMSSHAGRGGGDSGAARPASAVRGSGRDQEASLADSPPWATVRLSEAAPSRKRLAGQSPLGADERLVALSCHRPSRYPVLLVHDRSRHPA